MPRAARNTWRGADPAGGSPTQETPTPGLHHPAPKHCQRGTPKPAPRPKNPGSLQPCAQGCSRPKAALMAGAGTSGTRGRGRDISEAQRGWRRGELPLLTPAPAGSSRCGPCSVGTPRRRRLPRDPEPDPAPGAAGLVPAPRGCRIRPCSPTAPGSCLIDSLSIFETTGFHFEAILPVRN